MGLHWYLTPRWRRLQLSVSLMRSRVSHSAFVILRTGQEETEDLKKELAKHVRTVLGPVAYPESVLFVKDVPKTRSGKIMRRVIKAKALGKPTGDLSALANPDAVDAIPLI